MTLNDFLISVVGKLNKSVKTEAMVLTEEQKTQVRANIGALGTDYVPPSQTAEQVGADAKGTASSMVSTHNAAADSHSDIRLLIEGLTTRINAIADSSDTDLDQLSELVAYIKNNKSLIDGITTGKVSVSDIVDNLTTSVSNKPLSANQGVVLKGVIDTISTTLAKKPDLTDAEIVALSKLIK